MVTSLFKYDRIQTTDIKAKELRRWADQLVTLAKRGDLHARRIALSIIRERDVVQKLFEEAGQRYGSIHGGYTRIVKIGRRPGDAAPVSVIELVSSTAEKKKKEKKPKKEQTAAKPAVAVEAKPAEKEALQGASVAETAPAEMETVPEPEETAEEAPSLASDKEEE